MSEGGFSLVGEWEVEATVPGGGSYSGLVTARPVGAAVELEWDITAGRYVGLGLGAAGVWFVACGEDWEGLGLALVRVDGSVRWCPARQRGEVAATILEPSGARHWKAGPGTAPDFPFASIALNGARYLCEAELQGGPVARGLALPFPGGHALAWHPRFDQTVILRYAPGREPGTLEAVWGLGGNKQLAAETLRPLL
ncbi:MAG: hypothetical protein JW785_04045 [Acidimicrobiia bacterium]|nr:hypothetical protein [Acidimicrobiia bacterium]